MVCFYVSDLHFSSYDESKIRELVFTFNLKHVCVLILRFCIICCNTVSVYMVDKCRSLF